MNQSLSNITLSQNQLILRSVLLAILFTGLISGCEDKLKDKVITYDNPSTPSLFRMLNCYGVVCSIPESLLQDFSEIAICSTSEDATKTISTLRIDDQIRSSCKIEILIRPVNLSDTFNRSKSLIFWFNGGSFETQNPFLDYAIPAQLYSSRLSDNNRLILLESSHSLNKENKCRLYLQFSKPNK